MLPTQPQYLPTSKILSNRLFEIPQYQRAYSWTSKQRDDLFFDLQRTHERIKAKKRGPDGQAAGHFMATIVCLRIRAQELGTDEYDVVQVVDGQQRLTTIIIILKQIELHLDAKNTDESREQGDLADLLVKKDTSELLLLQTNHDSSNFFAEFLRRGKTPDTSNAKTIADRRLLAAINETRRFVSEWKRQYGDLLGLIGLIKNKVYFLLHQVDHEETVYTVFEVLNSRGLGVSRFDQLKSMLMGKSFDLPRTNTESLIDELHVTWKQIYSVIGLRQGMSTEALRFAATLRAPRIQSRPISEEDSLEQFRQQAKNAKEIRRVATWLLSVTHACDQLIGNRRLNAVTDIGQARLLAVAINLRDDFDETERHDLMRLWEKVTFRIYGLYDRDSRTRVGDYVRLAWRIINDQLEVATIATHLRYIGNNFPADEAAEQLRNENCYEEWEGKLRYLLYRYEEHLSKIEKQNFENEQWERIWEESPSRSIEHIWPQSRAVKSAKHRLGNLTILPPRLNSRLKNRKPADKIDEYRKTGLLITQEVASLIESQQKWNTTTIAQRESAIIEWVKQEWAD